MKVALVDESYNLNAPYFDNSSYVDWLESFTIDETMTDDRRLEYSKLIRTLWDIEYIPLVGNDHDRAAEGLELRSRYRKILAKKAGDGEFYTPDIRDIFGECRVLEMLVALSMRMYDLMQDLGFYNSVSRWFWEIMECVGFDSLDDSCWIDGRDEDMVEECVGHIMRGDGVRSRADWEGGWFGVHGWQHMEIWYQMHAYLKQYFE